MSFLFSFHWSCIAFPPDQVTDRKDPLSQSRIESAGTRLLSALVSTALKSSTPTTAVLCVWKVEQVNWRASHLKRWEVESVQRARSQPKGQKSWRKSFRKMLSETRELLSCCCWVICFSAALSIWLLSSFTACLHFSDFNFKCNPLRGFSIKYV